MAAEGSCYPAVLLDENSQPIGGATAIQFTEGSDQPGGLSAALVYVTSAGTPPTEYVTPLYFDSTAVTGGLYAWDGTEYVQVGGPLA